jgi:hypothetical protein
MQDTTRTFLLAFSIFALVMLALLIAYAIPRFDAAACVSIVMVFSLPVTTLALMFLLEMRGETLVRRWACTNCHRIVKLERRFARPPAYRVTVEGKSGKQRRAWIHCVGPWPGFWLTAVVEEHWEEG